MLFEAALEEAMKPEHQDELLTELQKGAAIGSPLGGL